MFYKSRKSPGHCNGIGGGKIKDNNWGHDCWTLRKQFSSVDIPLENGHGDMNYLDGAWCQIDKNLTTWTTAGSVKCPRYAGKTLPQAKSRRFEFLETNYGKILHEMSEGFTLYALEFSALLIEQSTILCVSRQQIFIIRSVFSATSQQPQSTC